MGIPDYSLLFWRRCIVAGALALCAVCPCSALDPSRVHAFYYIWYGTPEADGRWQHWDHEVLPHWTPHVNSRYPNIGEKFSPPEDLHSPFFPQRGPYSSRNKSVLLHHFQEMARSGIGVAVVSWWGQRNRTGTADTQGVQTDAAMGDVLAAAEAQSAVKVAFHLEPYPGRTAQSVREDVEYLLRRFGDSPALFRWGGTRPLFYVYDSYHIPPQDWVSVLGPGGARTLRGTPWDAVFIGLWLESGDSEKLTTAHFDGAYTYFASTGASYGADLQHWKAMSALIHRSNMLFFPSVGPGYDDSLIRPWNAKATKDRRGGEYYREAWRAALACAPDAVSVTSFNEWGEGTQIEPALPKVRLSGVHYLDYGVEGPNLYLQLTAEFSKVELKEKEKPALRTYVDDNHEELKVKRRSMLDEL